MPRNYLNLLTPLKIKNIKPEDKAVFYNDGGGLYLRVRQFKTKTTKEWVFRFTSPVTGTRRKQSLGSFPATSLKKAREIAQQSRGALDSNLDPIEEIQKAKDLEISKYRERQKKKTKTVEVVFYEWKASELKNRKDKGKEIERGFVKDVFPVMGKKPIYEVTRDDIKLILERPNKRGAKRMTNQLLTDLKQFFKYADDDDLIGADPTRKFNKARAGGKEQPRKRVLNEDELRLLNSKLKKSDIAKQYKHVLCVYLATGCRRNEIISTKLSAIDLKRRNLHIPADNAKNTKEHNVYLSDFALKHIKKLIALSNNDVWLMPNDEGDNHLSEGVISRHVRLRQPQQHEPGNSQWQKNHSDEFDLPGGHWVVHDLRRTAATIMQQEGVMPHIVKKCLNQRIDDLIMETYQRAELIKEQKLAFEKLGTYLSKLLS